MEVQGVSLSHRAPACHEYPVEQRTRRDVLSHTIHRRIVVGSDDNLTFQSQPGKANFCYCLTDIILRIHLQRCHD